MRDVPKLAWLGAKTFTQQGDTRKNRPGRAPEHTAAIIENASRTFTTEVDKALAQEPQEN